MADLPGGINENHKDRAVSLSMIFALVLQLLSGKRLPRTLAKDGLENMVHGVWIIVESTMRLAPRFVAGNSVRVVELR